MSSVDPVHIYDMQTTPTLVVHVVSHVSDKDVSLLWSPGVIATLAGLFYERGINLESNRCVNAITELDWSNTDSLLIMDDHHYI